jgi:uroporphyrinogen III methyltransferase/synthase
MQPDRSLSGRRIVVTRPTLQAEGLSEAFRAVGADVVRIPAFRVEAMGDELERCLANAGTIDYDTVVFTSQNAVKYFLDIADRAGVSGIENAEVVAVGPATAHALGRHGIRADVIADPHTAEGLVSTLLRAHPVDGKRVLYPRAADARDFIERELTAASAHVDSIVTYGAVAETLEDPEAAARTLAPAPDMVTFASPTAAIHLEHALTPAIFARVESYLKQEAATACIGPVTEDAATALGYRVEVVAGTHTVDGLVEAVAQYFAKES